jgi:hypothetical protein
MSTQCLVIFFESVTVKLFPIVNNQFSRNSKPTDYVLPKEFLNCWRFDVRKWFCFYPLREIIDCNSCEISNSPEPLVMALLDPFPTFAVAKMVGLSELALKVNFVDSLFFGMLHIAKQVP